MSLALGELTKYIIGMDYKNQKWIIDENAPEEIKEKLKKIEQEVKECREQGLCL